MSGFTEAVAEEAALTSAFLTVLSSTPSAAPIGRGSASPAAASWRLPRQSAATECRVID